MNKDLTITKKPKAFDIIISPYNSSMSRTNMSIMLKIRHIRVRKNTTKNGEFTHKIGIIYI